MRKPTGLHQGLIENLFTQDYSPPSYFREDLFTANHKRLAEVCDLLISRNYNIAWACEARADITDRNLLEQMRRSGCTGLYLGVEAGSDSALTRKKKDLDLDKFT